jgi:CheY-like chemotaxis protein
MATASPLDALDLGHPQLSLQQGQSIQNLFFDKKGAIFHIEVVFLYLLRSLNGMPTDDLLEDKQILVVDDERDILESVEEILSSSQVHKAQDFETALNHLMSYTYDLVILDIMGVNGFELLKNSVALGFPTMMLTAHALSPDALKKSIKLGAVFYLPKERISELESCVADILAGEGTPLWRRVFTILEPHFNKRFGLDWKERDRFFKEFERELRRSGQRE